MFLHSNIGKENTPVRLMSAPFPPQNLTIVLKYPDAAPVDITPELVKQGYNAEQMHRLSESFYKSLGYDPLPDVFWSKSMLVKPTDREAVCHASAWDMGGGEDLRIKVKKSRKYFCLKSTH